MARANTRTLLALDRWAQIVGIDPRHFNQVEVANLAPTRHCKQVWLQHAWQYADHISREEVARAIAHAERDLIRAIGYYPLPAWTEGEVKRLKGSSDVAFLGCSNLTTPAGRFRAVKAEYGMVIGGGIQVRESEGTPWIVWQDLDIDGYFETAQVQVATDATDVNEMRCYFTGREGADEWEIRPLRSVAIAGGIAIILIDRHLLVDPDLWEALAPASVNGLVDANFVDRVDVYRHYNDPSDQAELQWERMPNDCTCGSSTCPMCSWATQAACLQTRDPRLGIMTYQPGIWNAASEAFDLAALALGWQPDRISMNYRHGYRSTRVNRPYVEMDPDFEWLITMYSMCLLDRPVCGCSNVEQLYHEWTIDMALAVSTQAESSHYQIRDRDLACPWGTKVAAVRAWRMAQDQAVGGSVAY